MAVGCGGYLGEDEKGVIEAGDEAVAGQYEGRDGGGKVKAP